MSEATIPQDNYLTKIHQLWQTGALPRHAGYHEIAVEHDDWWGIFQTRRCDCESDISLKFSLAGSTN
jgi:hypothetical protein